YVPSSTTVVVVGDVSHTAVEKQVQAAFAADQPGANKPPYQLPAPETACEKPRREVLETPFNTGFVGMAFPAPGVGNQPDVYAMDILVTLLEHGPFGRLPEALRGKSGAVQASFETRRQPGLLTIVAQADPRNLAAVEKTLQDEIRNLVDKPPSAAEIDFTR